MKTAISRRMRLTLEIGWGLIAVKCILVVWAIAHWMVPIHPAWIVVPSILFAGLVTAVALWERPY